jgi:hypothetical protein
MAEEAVGLAKSLGWSIEQGPAFLERKDPEEVQEVVESAQVIPVSGRKIGMNDRTVEGEQIKNWDKVYVHGTNLHGYFFNGKLMIDHENYSEGSDSDIEGLNEWTDPGLRQNLAVSGLVRIRKQGAPGFFGKGKVTFNQIVEITNHVKNFKISTVFINTLLTPVQQRNLET